MPAPPEPNRTVPLPPDQLPPAAVDPDAPASRFGPPARAGEVGTLGAYRVIKELGKGGMGAVYLALDTRLERQLALKVLLPEFAANSEAKCRFLREARAAAKISHDNVVIVHEADERAGLPYIAMQFLHGHSLDEYLKGVGRPALPQVLRIVREAAAGLAAAHELGLVHRDIKPANLWLEAPNGRVKVLDFGLARSADADTDLTKSGAIVGTPAYMSPEQARGLKVDHRTDLFSLGAVLYQLCTGRLPFVGPNPLAVLIALGTENPPPVRDMNPQVPEPLAQLIHALLAKNPDRRPQSAAEVMRRLDALATGAPAPAAPPTPVTAGANAFADIDLNEGQSDTIEAPPGAEPTRPRSYLWVWAAGTGSVAALCVAAALFALKGSAHGQKGTAPSPGPLGDPAPIGSGSVGKREEPDADRRAADWVLELGGKVRVDAADRDLKTAAELPDGPFRLTGVSFHDNPQVTDTNLQKLRGLKHLTYVNLAYTSVGNTGLNVFRESKALTALVLTRTKITDDGLIHLRGLENLTTLNLHDTRVGNAGLAQIRGLKSIERLYLHYTNVTDAGLVHLREFKNLTWLTLYGTQITDAGLNHLKEVKSLTILGLTSGRLTAERVAELRGSLPGCEIRLSAPGEQKK